MSQIQYIPVSRLSQLLNKFVNVLVVYQSRSSVTQVTCHPGQAVSDAAPPTRTQQQPQSMALKLSGIVSRLRGALHRSYSVEKQL